MISKTEFFQLLVLLDDQGRADVAWANGCKPPTDPDNFASEVIYVICNSGMKFEVARLIYDRVMPQVRAGGDCIHVFGHKGKAAAMDKIWAERERLFAEFNAAEDKVAYARTIPWIGGITAYHVAKNFGAQVAKPDVHLQRLADLEGVTAQQLCERLAGETGYCVSAVDTIIWRACATGVMDSRTGKISERSLEPA
jgi:hypothetical protein